MSMFPKGPKKIKQRIRRYERELRNEQNTFGQIRDGYGKRYLLGPLYMLLGDVEGALESFEWFEQNFPDDIGEPFQYLCWTLALFRVGDQEGAARKLAQTWFKNLYLVPYLLGIEQPKLDIWHSSNLEEPDYVEYGAELFDLWDEEALQWAGEVYQAEWFERIRVRSLEIKRQLKREPVGSRRTRLVKEKYDLERLKGVKMR